jgi:hypothetical protein
LAVLSDLAGVFAVVLTRHLTMLTVPIWSGCWGELQAYDIDLCLSPPARSAIDEA